MDLGFSWNQVLQIYCLLVEPWSRYSHLFIRFSLFADNTTSAFHVVNFVIILSLSQCFCFVLFFLFLFFLFVWFCFSLSVCFCFCFVLFCFVFVLFCFLFVCLFVCLFDCFAYTPGPLGIIAEKLIKFISSEWCVTYITHQHKIKCEFIKNVHFGELWLEFCEHHLLRVVFSSFVLS